MQREAQGKRKFTGWYIFKNGKRVFMWDPNQGMGSSCHKGADVMNPGMAVERKQFEDPPKPPDDLEYDRRVVQM